VGFSVRTQIGSLLYVVLMVAAIIIVDVSFFKNRVWVRLAANVGIILVFAAIYFGFVKRR
jgi:hypothetical protein